MGTWWERVCIHEPLSGRMRPPDRRSTGGVSASPVRLIPARFDPQRRGGRRTVQRMTMKPITGAVAAAGLTFALAACGGASGKASSPPVTNGHPDPTVVASKIGCGGYVAQTGQIEFFAATEGDCKIGTADVSIMTFSSDSSFGKWRAAAKAATGGDGTVVVGDRWAVEATNADQATRLASLTGGSTQ